MRASIQVARDDGRFIFWLFTKNFQVIPRQGRSYKTSETAMRAAERLAASLNFEVPESCKWIKS